MRKLATSPHHVDLLVDIRVKRSYRFQCIKKLDFLSLQVLYDLKEECRCASGGGLYYLHFDIHYHIVGSIYGRAVQTSN